MSEMKLCPFCGSKALTNTFLDYEDIENLPTNVIDDYEPEVTCENERCIYGWWLSPKDWNNRPIEDALQARIAELEAAQRWTPVSERLPEEDTDGNTLMAVCRHSGEWVRAPFGADFADEFVRHYSYWMYAPQPPEVQE